MLDLERGKEEENDGERNVVKITLRWARSRYKWHFHGDVCNDFHFARF